MEAKRPITSVIIPTLNEENNLRRILGKVWEHADEVYIIDGHSTDGTVSVARELGAKVLFQKGRGKGEALRQAFAEVDSDFIIIMDADCSMRPAEIPSFVKTLSDSAHVAKGSRFLPTGTSIDISRTRRIGNKILVSLVNLLWSTRYTDLCYGYMGFRREALEKLAPHLRSSNFEIETEICIAARELDLEVAEVPSVELRRLHGSSRLHSFRDGLRIFLVILKEFFKGQSA